MSNSEKAPVLVVGNGIAGVVMAHTLELQNCPYRLLDDGHRSASSLAAAGMYNPLILKRLRKAWGADRFTVGLEEYYSTLQEKLQASFLHSTGLLRRIDSVKELNDWESRKSEEGFRKYLGKTLLASEYADRIDIGHGFLEVPVAGWVDVEMMLKANKRYQKAKERYIDDIFDDSQVGTSAESIQYRGQSYSSIILCRGYKEWKSSRFFPDLPFSPAKGQTMILHVPGLSLPIPLHMGIFILPLGDDRYRIGSTYSWSKFNQETEESKREELLQKFSKRCALPYTVESEVAGVRPAVRDRRPMLGRSKEDGRVLLFNGLGSRGIMLAPQLSENLFNHLNVDAPLMTEVDIQRFSNS